MADIATLRRLALQLPGTADESDEDRVSFTVAGKGFAWSYLARARPKARREPVPGAVAIRCALEKKEILVAAEPDLFFDDEHYRGYPAVLVRLAKIDTRTLKGLLGAAWEIAAEKAKPKRKKKAPARKRVAPKRRR